MRKSTIILSAKGVLIAFSLLVFQLIHAQNWAQIQGISAQDIGVGKNGTVWATGTNDAIYRWNGSSWQTMPGGAVRVAVDPDGVAWVVNRGGYIYKYNAALSNGWELKPGSAKDIGIGADGSVWIIGTGATGGGYRIYKWNGSDWKEMGGGAVRIAVDPPGNAWVVNNTNNVFHWEGNTWVMKLGAVKDIGVGANGIIWCTGADGRVYQWDVSNWKMKTGGASQISVAPDGNAWVVNDGGQVFRTTDAGVVLIRTIFPRKQQYEYSILRALNYGILGNTIVMGGGGTYNNLDNLGKGFGTYALLAAEILYSDNSTITADQVIGNVSRDTKVKSSLNGILCALLMNSLVSRQIDPAISFESREALRNWSSNLFWAIKVRAAKSILTEYQKWKADPCTYQADDYKAPPDCALGGLNYTQWYGTHSPPQDIIGKAGLKSVLANNADAVASGVAFAAAAVTIGAAAGALASALGVTVVASTTGTVLASGVAVGAVSTSLFAAFGGTGGAAAGGAAAIGGAGFAGVAAAPVAAAILAIVVGTIEGFRVVENAKV
ncbi:MAG TPA: tectonin domain-containing protein, partial [Chitinophagaceae bacterium]|nr:tectonin domain-containing protein [Chitinophagaceae bacterium]